MGRLSDRGVMVTGATGIAEASVHRFAAEGARVFVISRTEEHCRTLIDTVAAAGGAAAYAVADLMDGSAAATAAAAGIEWLGRVDALFNVAGGSGRPFGDGPLHTLEPEAWEATLRLNATSHVTITAPVIRAMLAQERDSDGLRGAILNMTSVLATQPVPALFGTHAYAAAKGAIGSLTLASAAHYAPDGIRVNAVAPALTSSRMSRRAASDPATVAFARAKQPLTAGFIDAEDIAAAALYLISAEARAVTGQILAVDAGWSVTQASTSMETDT
jgi:NAD(P)-dependent dehydrogenase (short-subunit alcohol dehydrogenase family)